jgi:hypothetical protein
MNQERFDARCRLLPCVVCVALEVIPPMPCHELHHLGDPNTVERDEKAKVPICFDHHQGPNGIHGLRRRGFATVTQLSDLRLLTIRDQLFLETLP